MLIRDFRILDNIQVLSEDKSDGTMKIRGLFQRADEVNQNKRRYGRKIMESAVTGLQEMINDNRLCGELDHPSYEMVKLQNASHRITKLEMKGNDVIGEAVILPTPAGQVAQQLIRGGVKLGISSRGVGSVSEGKDGISEVNDDYKMVTFDLVADPSVHDAFPGLTESKDSQAQSAIVESTMKKVHGEAIFLQLLENKLQEGSGGKNANTKRSIRLKPKRGSSLAKRIAYKSADSMSRDTTRPEGQAAGREMKSYYEKNRKITDSITPSLVEKVKNSAKLKVEANVEEGSRGQTGTLSPEGNKNNKKTK